MAPLKPEHIQDLADYFGSQRAAAQNLGIPKSTFHKWSNPERERELNRESCKRYSEKYPDRRRESHRRSDHKHRHKKMIKSREYRKNNPIRVKITQMLSKQRRKTKIHRQQLKELDE